MTLTDVLHQARHAPLSSHARCVLCGRRPTWRGVFLPRDSVAYGGRAEKQRCIIYCLCKRCRRRPAVLDEVEDRLLTHVNARWN